MSWRSYLMVGAAVFLAACGRGAADGITFTDAAPGGMADVLPPFSALPAPAHSAKLVGPGFVMLDPQTTLLSNGTENDGTALIINSDLATGNLPAFALYGLRGFAPGTGPTSYRLTFSDVTEQVYFAYADYARGRWQFSGPYLNTVLLELPGAGIPDPADYLSPEGYAYFAVFCATGHRARLTLVELGLQGGLDAPAPVTAAQFTGESWPYLLSWTRSVDYAELDFAGYLVERAPLLGGSFQALTPAPTKAHYLLDDTADPGEQYRMRIAAVDVSGNQSAWFELSGPDGGPMDPVCILKGPAGPAGGPVEVTFDLSASFDPQGQAITEYRISLGGGVPDATGTNPLITLDLQPGCYVVSASITTDDARSGYDYQRLKVYPQWQSSPVVVRNFTIADKPCLEQARLYRDPGTGMLSICALDRRAPGVSLWREGGALGYDWALAPDYGWARQLEPYATGSGPQFVLLGAGGAKLGLAQQVGTENAAYPGLAGLPQGEEILGVFTGADGQPWVVKLGRGGGSFPLDFVAAPLVDLGSETLIAAADAQQHYASMEQDATSGIVHILAGSASAVPDYYPLYAQFDPAANATVLNEAVTEFTPGADVEYDALAGDTWTAYYDGTFIQTLQRTGGVWQAPVAVDNGSANQDCFDLALGAGGPCVLASITRPRLYAWDTAAWVLRNQPDYTALPAISASLVVEPGTDEFFALTIASGGVLHLGALHPNGSIDMLEQWRPTTGAGPGLSAAADAVGVHVLARSIVEDVTYYYYSMDGCASFIQRADQPGYDWIDLTATQAGQVHLSSHSGLTSRLAYWDGAQFTVASTHVGSSPAYPLLSQVPELNVSWAAYDEGTDTLMVVTGRPGAGYNTDTQPCGITPALTGVLSPAALNPRAFILGGYNGGSGSLDFAGLLTIPGAVQTPLFTPLQSGYLDLPAANCNGCAITAAGYCQGNLGEEPAQVFWSAFGSGAAPERALVKDDGTATLAQVPGGWSFDPQVNALRSIQAAQADGDTAVCVAAGLLGEPLTMEWSNNGAWEQLPVPPSMAGLSKYELCVDKAGQWHLFGHDWRNDRLLSLSTNIP